MADLPNPYIAHKPGELITANEWNDMQGEIKNDISDQIKAATTDITKGKVASAGDSDKLGGQTAAELTDAILKKLRAEIPGQTGYRMYFKRLSTDEEKIIEHGLAAVPLVDICQLDYFPVVCGSSDQKTPTRVNFYVYHSSEKRIRLPGPPAMTIEIEPSEKTHAFKVPFKEMLDRFKVQFTDLSSLSDVINDLWSAMFQPPNDEFDQDQYCHSPWFDRCCCVENASIKAVRDRGDLDDIWVKWMPRKTVNYPLGNNTTPAGTNSTAPAGSEVPQNVQVEHFDFNTLGIKLLLPPVYPVVPKIPPAPPDVGDDLKKELKVMVLLKV